LDVVGGVDADRYAPGEVASIKSKAPFRGVESDDIDCCEFFTFVSNKSFGKFKALIVILSEGVRELNNWICTQDPFFFTERAGFSFLFFMVLWN
jgi:hypothetical protein